MVYASLQPRQSMNYDQQAIEVLNRVTEPHRNYPSFRILLARVHSNLIFSSSQLNQYDEALAHARAAEEIYLPLEAASPGDRDLRYRLAVLRRLTGMVESYAKRWQESAEDFSKGIADYDALLQAGPNVQYRAYRAELRMRMADALWEEGRKQDAETAARLGLSEFRELTKAPDASFPLLRQATRYLLFTEVETLRSPREALALAERCRNTTADRFQLFELLAAAYAENHLYRQAADHERQALTELPPLKPGEPPSRARQSIEKDLAEYQRKALLISNR
jgi:tetratricopeptide (TPR) repeat protein